VRSRRDTASRPRQRPRAYLLSTGKTEMARLTRELDEAREQLTATSEMLKVISSSWGGLEPVFEAILENATRICQARFKSLSELGRKRCLSVMG
jgi:hypothetical protein